MWRRAIDLLFKSQGLKVLLLRGNLRYDYYYGNGRIGILCKNAMKHPRKECASAGIPL